MDKDSIKPLKNNKHPLEEKGCLSRECPDSSLSHLPKLEKKTSTLESMACHKGKQWFKDVCVCET